MAMGDRAGPVLIHNENNSLSRLGGYAAPGEGRHEYDVRGWRSGVQSP
jgi:hypothetical protein